MTIRLVLWAHAGAYVISHQPNLIIICKYLKQIIRAILVIIRVHKKIFDSLRFVVRNPLDNVETFVACRSKHTKPLTWGDLSTAKRVERHRHGPLAPFQTRCL